MNGVLEWWNGMDADTAVREVLPCCGSRTWSEELAKLRPFVTVEDLFAASDSVWLASSEEAWQEAFDSHPRIGEREASVQATDESLRWSASEQRDAMSEDAVVQQALAEGNRQYEARFGRIFIVCASGRSAAEILAALGVRMNNDAGTELREAVEQQRQITQLRLRRWLGLAEAEAKDDGLGLVRA
jgi:2-oxo-4-hydroxy-4-carboxy-5-ureidoimidazoline decarboxylase